MAPKKTAEVPVALRLSLRRPIFRADGRTGSSRVKWEVQRPAGVGKLPNILFDLRTAAREAAGLNVNFRKCFAVGLQAASRAVERGAAAGVLLCCEGVPAILMQHLPVLCALRRVPVAVMAATTLQMREVLAILQPTVAEPVAVALLAAGCSSHPPLTMFCRQMRETLPPVRLPYLFPTEGIPRLLHAETPKTPGAGPPEELILRLDPLPTKPIPSIPELKGSGKMVSKRLWKDGWGTPERSASTRRIAAKQAALKRGAPLAGPSSHPTAGAPAAASAAAPSKRQRQASGAPAVTIDPETSATTIDPPPAVPAANSKTEEKPGIYDFFEDIPMV